MPKATQLERQRQIYNHRSSDSQAWLHTVSLLLSSQKTWAQRPKGSRSSMSKRDYSPERSLVLLPEDSGISGGSLHTNHRNTTTFRGRPRASKAECPLSCGSLGRGGPAAARSSREADSHREVGPFPHPMLSLGSQLPAGSLGTYKIILLQTLMALFFIFRAKISFTYIC